MAIQAAGPLAKIIVLPSGDQLGFELWRSGSWPGRQLRAWRPPHRRPGCTADYLCRFGVPTEDDAFAVGRKEGSDTFRAVDQRSDRRLSFARRAWREEAVIVAAKAESRPSGEMPKTPVHGIRDAAEWSVRLPVARSYNARLPFRIETMRFPRRRPARAAPVVDDGFAAGAVGVHDDDRFAGFRTCGTRAACRRATNWASRRGRECEMPVPSAPMTAICESSKVWPTPPVSKAINLPSGDQSGEPQSNRAYRRNGRGRVPSALIFQSSQAWQRRCCGSATTKIVRNNWRSAYWQSGEIAFANHWASFNSWSNNMLRSGTWLTKIIVLPSGDQSGFVLLRLIDPAPKAARCGTGVDVEDQQLVERGYDSRFRNTSPRYPNCSVDIAVLT